MMRLSTSLHYIVNKQHAVVDTVFFLVFYNVTNCIYKREKDIIAELDGFIHSMLKKISHF